MSVLKYLFSEVKTEVGKTFRVVKYEIVEAYYTVKDLIYGKS